jgi:hypothetical protein
MNIPKALIYRLKTLNPVFVEDYPQKTKKLSTTEFGIYQRSRNQAAITFAHLEESHLLSSFEPIHNQLCNSELHKYGLLHHFTPNRNSHPIFASVNTSKSNFIGSLSYSPITHEYCQQTID